MYRFKILLFYVLCILYRLGMKSLAINISRFNLVAFQNVDENAFIITSKLNKSYIQNDPHFSENEMLKWHKDTKFSVRDMPLFYFSLKKLREVACSFFKTKF